MATGLRPQPSDKNIIAHLLDRVNGNPVTCQDGNPIPIVDIYGEREPWDIIDDLGANQENYYFLTRLKKSNTDIQGSPEFNQKIGQGMWKECSPITSIMDKKDRKIGFVQSFEYINEGDPDHDRRWIMKTYSLGDMFERCFKDDYVDCVLCSIRRVCDEEMGVELFFDQMLEKHPENPISSTGQTRAQIGKVLRLGNSAALIYFWTILGLVGATLWPIFLSESKDKNVPYYMISAFFATVLIYALGFWLRQRAVMRERRNWWQSIFCNLLISAITVATSDLHKVSPHGMIAQIFIASAVFGFMEIAKPVFDFGTLQYYLRLPLLTSVQHYHRISKWHFITAALLVVGTIWQSFYLHVFNQQQVEREKERDEGHKAAQFAELTTNKPTASLNVPGDGLQPTNDEESQSPGQ